MEPAIRVKGETSKRRTIMQDPITQNEPHAFGNKRNLPSRKPTGLLGSQISACSRKVIPIEYGEQAG
jgi:hypothetical protein